MTDLKQLTQQWKEAKASEQHFNQLRISIESQIYELTEKELTDKGTYTTDTGMKITTGFSEDWNSDQVTLAYQQWPDDVKFPFATVWKPDGKAVSYLRDNQPTLYKLIQPALTIKPKKPSFSITAEK